MNIVKRTFCLINILVLGLFFSHAYGLQQESFPIEKESAKENIKPQNVQIWQNATVKLVVTFSDGIVGYGSGFFIREDLIVTNIHVVAGIHGKQHTTSVELNNQSMHYSVTGVVATDPEHDLVILKVEGQGSGVLKIGDSDSVKLGDDVTTIGTNKDVPADIVKGKLKRIATSYFRLQATLPSGFSGAPVINEDGEVIAICTEGGETKRTGTVVPSKYLTVLLRDMTTHEKSLKQWREEPMIRAYSIVTKADAENNIGNYNKAVKGYDTAINLMPDFAVAYIRRAAAKMKLRDYNSGINDYSAAIRLGHDFADVYVNRAHAKRSFGDYIGAIKDCNTGMSLDPENIEAYLTAGDSKSDLLNYELAIQDYTTALNLKPNDLVLAVVYLKRADAKYRLGDKEGAIEDYHNTISVKSNNTNIYIIARLNGGIAKLDLERIDDAMKDFNEVIRLKSYNALLAKAHFYRATAKFKLGDKLDAINDYDTAIHLSSNNADFMAENYVSKANVKLEMNDVKGAIEDCDTAIKLRPQLAEAYKLRGDARLNQKRYSDAIKNYDTAIYITPVYTEAYYKRGKAKVERGNTSSGKIDFRTALKLVKYDGCESLKEEIEKNINNLK